MIDIYHSRRTRYRKCSYWLRDDDKPVEYLIHNAAPSGIFYAIEDNAIAYQNNVVNGNALFDRNSVVLKTDDDVDNIKQNCVIKYNKEIWFVNDVQKHLHIKETAIGNQQHATTYLTIRR